MTAIADNLRKARAKIANRKAWTQSYIALTAAGEPTDPDNPKAACWCARGALEAVGCCTLPGDEDTLDYDLDLTEWSFLREAARRSGYDSIEAFNDGQTHTSVLRLYDRAIALAEAA